MCAVLAVDIGTTNVKAAAFDADGVMLGVGGRRQAIVSPRTGWREHRPSDTWAAAQAAIREAVTAVGARAAEIEAIAVTGPRGSLVVLAEDNTPLTPILTWQDRRGTTSLGSTLDPTTYYQIAGTPLDPSVALARVLWLRGQTPELICPRHRLATPHGYVLTRLGAAAPAIDYTCAAHLGLLDVGQLTWSARLLRAFDVPAAMLPPLRPPGVAIGRLGVEPADALGLRPDLPLVLAGSDGVCAELGAGALAEGEVYGYVGTASTVAGPVLRPRLDPAGRLIVMPGARPDRWRVLALAMAGGSALDWFAGAVERPTFDELEALLTASPPGARGVRFMPTLAGAGAPFWDVAARGAFLGLSLSTDRADLTRAVLEGVALEMGWMLRALHDFGVAGEMVHLAGGGTRSPGWCQIMADVIQVPIERVAETELGLRGAAFYALAATGAYADVLDAARRLRLSGELYEPNPALAATYRAAADLYRLVRDTFRERGLDKLLLDGETRMQRPG